MWLLDNDHLLPLLMMNHRPYTNYLTDPWQSTTVSAAVKPPASLPPSLFEHMLQHSHINMRVISDTAQKTADNLQQSKHQK